MRSPEGKFRLASLISSLHVPRESVNQIWVQSDSHFISLSIRSLRSIVCACAKVTAFDKITFVRGIPIHREPILQLMQPVLRLTDSVWLAAHVLRDWMQYRKVQSAIGNEDRRLESFYQQTDVTVYFVFNLNWERSAWKWWPFVDLTVFKLFVLFLMEFSFSETILWSEWILILNHQRFKHPIADFKTMDAHQLYLDTNCLGYFIL